jgi:hypothetical protein
MVQSDVKSKGVIPEQRYIPVDSVELSGSQGLEPDWPMKSSATRIGNLEEYQYENLSTSKQLWIQSAC